MFHWQTIRGEAGGIKVLRKIHKIKLKVLSNYLSSNTKGTAVPRVSYAVDESFLIIETAES